MSMYSESKVKQRFTARFPLEVFANVDPVIEGCDSHQQLSPHFREDTSRVEYSRHPGTVDGDGIEELKLSNERSLHEKGVQYLRPNPIGKRSFATTDNDPEDHEDFFVGHGYRLGSIDLQNA